MAPTTPLGQKTTTSPRGRESRTEGPPIRMCELLATLDGPAYIERVALTDAKNHMRARKAVRKALKNQMEGRGFSFLEVLSACPSNWKLTPKEAVQWVNKYMVPVFPLGVFKDEDKGGVAPGLKKDSKASFPSIPVGEKADAGENKGAVASGDLKDVSMKLSGFGGQGVLFSGLALAEGALREGLQVSWIPSIEPAHDQTPADFRCCCSWSWRTDRL